MDAPALEVTGVSKRYGATVALDDASFAVQRGDMHALIGENGAGKSTLVKILSGTVRPDEGGISVGGQSVRLRSARDALAAGLTTAFQELTLVPHLTVAQNMLLGREPHNRAGLVSSNRLAAETLQILSDWDLEDVDPEIRVIELSLAVRQQIELVRVLSRNASVLLLDEPTAALGSVQVEWLFRQIRRAQERDSTVVFISHRMSEVREICDRVTVLRGGHEVATFDTTEADDDEVVAMMLGHAVERLEAIERSTVRQGPTVVAVSGLSCEPALRSASFSLRQGEVLGVAALQGHGQFELFMTLFGARRATGGQMEVDGKALHIRSPHDAIHKGIGITLVPEDRKAEGVLLEMSGLVNVTLPNLRRFSRLGFLRKGAERAEASNILRSVNVRLSALDGEVSALSGGNQQKLAIGKWMLAGARVLLMYDPTRGVDIGTKTEIFTMMRKMAEEGRSLLFYSTDIEELLGVSDRILIMYRGSIVNELSGASCTRNAVLSAMLGTASEVLGDGAPSQPSINGAA